MGLGNWLARNMQDAADAEQQSTSDAIKVGRGIGAGFRAAIASYQHDKANENSGDKGRRDTRSATSETNDS